MELQVQGAWAPLCAAHWDLADAIRDQLKDLGLTIEDTAAGTRIKSL